MADKTPIRGAYNGSSLTGLAEYATGDTVGVSFGGTGLATVGSNQLLTGNGTSALTSESNLTYDGTTLATTAFTATGNVSLDGGTFVFNESGADKDFRVEGDSEANLLMIDASTDRIGIGTATPSHLLDVEGVAHIATCIVTPKICISSQYVLPAADGSAGEILCTDGSGTIAFAEAASSGHTIANEGSVLASRTCLNFTGAGVTASDNSGTNATDVLVCATNALLGIRAADGTACTITLSNAAVGTCLQSDTAPKLGGNLDVNSNSIVSASNGNIPITPNGSGIVILDGICHPTADGSAGQVLCTNGSAALQWATLSAGVTLNGSTDNTIATVTGSNALQGESNLTFDGSTLQVTGALTVGVDDTGHDVQFFGASAGNYMLWDQSADEMILRIGTTSTYAANTETGNLKLVNAGSDTDKQSVGIAFDVGAGNVGAIGKARIDAVHNGTGANSDLVFATQVSGTVTERLRIDCAGYVGIGIYSNCNRALSAHAGKLGVFYSNGNCVGYAAAQIMSLVNFNCTASAVTALTFIGTHCSGSTGDRGPAIAVEHVCNTSTGGQADHGNIAFHPDYNSSPAMRICTSMGVYMSSGLCVNGYVSKASGSFTIEHPLESKKDTHKLVHSFIEGPQADLFYSGTTQLSDGTATVNVDTEAGMTEGTFVALNRCVRVFTSNETNWDAVRGSITDNVLTIESNVADSTACVSWMVIGERHDKHMYDTGWTDDEGRVIVEPEISDDDLPPGETLESHRKANE